jgi:hypothetical protein
LFLLLGAFFEVAALIALFGQRDGFQVPGVPPSCFVAGYEQDAGAPGVEGEQDADGAGS